MASRIEDYGLIGDTETVALVGRDGSIDWFCAPRFDSGACFAALLGDSRHGRWLIAPVEPAQRTTRAYRRDSLVLETEFEVSTGRVKLIDCMPIRDRSVDIVRVVEGVSGEVPVRMELIVRFDYGAVVPWVRKVDKALRAIAGPDAVTLWSPVETRGVDLTTQAEFTVRPGERVAFRLAWHASHESPGRPRNPLAAVEATDRWWRRWASRCTYKGRWRDAVVRSLITLKALTFAPTGGIVAAATTSLPEQLGGVRNWDYRYCWLRDATLTVYALIAGGYTDEAKAWTAWLLRAAGGDPSTLAIMYGPAGERRLTELELPWLPGYEGARPVRIGNLASEQLQLDVYGELLDAMHVMRRAGVEHQKHAWALQKVLLGFLEKAWTLPDEGIWEVRGPRRHFTHSKVMAWVAFDRAIQAVERFGLDGPVDRWRAVRQAIHDNVTTNAFDRDRGTFTQYPGTPRVDASLLLIPAVGFLPPDDPRVVGTVAAVERELMYGGLVYRYLHDESTPAIDGLPAGEGAFLACSFWLADVYALQRRDREATELFERLLALGNDLGLLAEQFDLRAHRMVGNFPQALSHVALINTAYNLAAERGPAEDRRHPDESVKMSEPA